MSPSLGLLLPLMFGQSPVVQASACAPCDAKASFSMGSASCLPLRLQPQYMGYPWQRPTELCAPVGPPAPLLAMRTVLPKGSAIVFDGTETGHGTQSTFGFRPGYAYRFRVDGLPEKPGEALGGTIEVRGSIVPRVNMKYMEFTAPIFISQADIDRVLAGGIVTKVIYLENPENAIAQESKPELPIEVSTTSERTALAEAEANGRIAAIVRLGDRAPTKQELSETFIPGTVLLPGETRLGRPTVPPLFGECAVPLYDPILGPKTSTEECFPNGGDGKVFAGVGPGGRMNGLDPTDVIAEYTRGTRREVTTSNVVCLCAPRFVTRRVEQGISGLASSFAPSAAIQVVSKSIFSHREQAQQYVSRERTLGLSTRTRPSAAVALVMLHAVGSTQGLKILAKTDGIQLTGAVISPEEATSFPARLMLTKSVEPAGPYQSGDVVTITLKYFNTTREPVTDLLISDRLSPRLEVVPGTSASDRVSNVTTVENDGGDTTIRFDIPGPIPPSGQGRVVFKVKVR